MEPQQSFGDDGRVELNIPEKKTFQKAWFERYTRNGKQCRSNLDHTKLRQEKKPEDLPVPKLNIAIHIVGSRGDIQPFIPIAQLLSRPPYNHRVRLCTHPVFRKFVEDNGIEFFSIGGDPESLMAYMVKNPGLLPGRESIRDGDIGKRRKEMAEIIEGCWRSCIAAGNGSENIEPIDVESVTELFLADAIIANPPSYAHIHCAEKLGIPLHIVFTMPWSASHEFSHPLASFAKSDANARTLNFHSFGLMELLAWQGLGDIINNLRVDTLKLSEVSPLWGHILLNRLQVPHSYCWSQSLIPKPSDWADHLSVTGFSFLKLATSYIPPQDLLDFLNAGPAPIYIGFGSIVVADPKALTELILKAVQKAGVRAIISRGWGGVSAEAVPPNVHFIGNCPHDWLFEQVSVVVHHGGAGTTAAGIAAGKPTVIVPFFGDQPFWANMVWRAGAGPQPVPFKQMTADTLAQSIRTAQRPDVKNAVNQMRAKIAAEDGALQTVLNFHDKLDIDRMRCQVCPDQLAIWDVKLRRKTYQLSNRAVAVLVQEKVINASQCRLAHNIRWDVDEGAESLSVGLIATIGSIGHGIVKSTQTYSQRLKAKRHKCRDLPESIETEKPKISRKRNMVDSAALTRSITLDRIDDELVYKIANRMAAKRYSVKAFESEDEIRARRTQRSRALEVVAGTAAFAGDLLKVGLRAPVTFTNNMANGCHNMVDFINSDSALEHYRQRKEIHGFRSGLAVGAQGSALGLYDAFASFVRLPIRDARNHGLRGAARGVGRATVSLPLNLGAALFSLPGYTLKGLERDIHKRRLSKLEADLLIIRIRQLLAEWPELSADNKQEILQAWKRLTVPEVDTNGQGAKPHP